MDRRLITDLARCWREPGLRPVTPAGAPTTTEGNFRSAAAPRARGPGGAARSGARAGPRRRARRRRAVAGRPAGRGGGRAARAGLRDVLGHRAGRRGHPRPPGRGRGLLDAHRVPRRGLGGGGRAAGVRRGRRDRRVPRHRDQPGAVLRAARARRGGPCGGTWQSPRLRRSEDKPSARPRAQRATTSAPGRSTTGPPAPRSGRGPLRRCSSGAGLGARVVRWAGRRDARTPGSKPAGASPDCSTPWITTPTTPERLAVTPRGRRGIRCACSGTGWVRGRADWPTCQPGWWPWTAPPDTLGGRPRRSGTRPATATDQRSSAAGAGRPRASDGAVSRLHSMIGNMPPTEYEQIYYAHATAREDPISGEPGLH